MFSAHYSYKCSSCKTDPLHGDLKASDSAAQMVLGILDKSWADTHNRPGCTPAAEARTLTHRGKGKTPAPAGGE